MIDVVFKTAGAIIVLNIVILLAPDGQKEKYVSFISGLVILAVMIGSFKNITLPSEMVFPEFESSAYENKALENELFSQTEDALEQSFMEYAQEKYSGAVRKISVDFDGEIKNIEIYINDSSYIEDVGNTAAEFFGTDKSRLTIKK